MYREGCQCAKRSAAAAWLSLSAGWQVFCKHEYEQYWVYIQRSTLRMLMCCIHYLHRSAGGALAALKSIRYITGIVSLSRWCTTFSGRSYPSLYPSSV